MKCLCVHLITQSTPLAIGEQPTELIQAIRPMGIEALVLLTRALQLFMQLSSRAVIEWTVVVSDILEVVDLFAREQEGDADGVHGRVAPALVEELACPVERVEELAVRFRSEEVQVADLEVGPD